MPRYVLETRIGEGGMAEVWRARLEGAHGFVRIVAVKRPLPKFASDAALHKRFIDEARITGALRHPCIIPVIDFFEENGLPHVVMEFVDGVSLEHLCLRGYGGRFIPPHLAARIAKQVARGLAHAHEEGVLHRDMSCCNVLVSRHGEVRISDFGLAEARGRLSRTEPGSMLGKTRYLSPERMRELPATASDDLFALGVVIDQMLSAADPRARAADTGVALREIARRLRQPRAERTPSAPALLEELSAIHVGHEDELADHVRVNPQARTASLNEPVARRLTAEELEEVTLSDARMIAARHDAARHEIAR